MSRELSRSKADLNETKLPFEKSKQYLAFEGGSWDIVEPEPLGFTDPYEINSEYEGGKKIQGTIVIP